MLRRENLSWSSHIVVLVVATIFLAVGLASGQAQDEPVDTYYVTYYSDALTAWAPIATVHIVNPGTSLTRVSLNGQPLDGNLCADIYVLNNDQQVVECCGCNLTPDSESWLTIDANLLGNPINPRLMTSDGVIKAVSAANNMKAAPFCNPSLPSIVPTAALRLWTTHIQSEPGPRYTETEEPFASVPLSDNELLYLENQCSAIYISGSGHGVCSCGQ